MYAIKHDFGNPLSPKPAFELISYQIELSMPDEVDT